MNFYQILIILLLLASNATVLNTSCALERQCTSCGECKNLQSFSQLNISGCHDENPYFVKCSDNKYLLLSTNSPLILDNTLELNYLINITIGSSDYDIGVVQFYDLKGFDSNLLTKYENVPGLEFDFYKINFAIYDNGHVSDMSCHNFNWLNRSQNFLSLFNGKLVKIGDSNFVTNMCPTVFHLVHYDTLYIQGKMIHFDAKNYLFLEIVQTEIINVKLKYMYNLELSNRTIHPSVFGKMNQFSIEISSIHTIQTNLFERMDQLRHISLHIINLRYFFHINQIDWLQFYNLKDDNIKYFGNSSDETVEYITDAFAVLHIQNNLNDHILYPVRFFPYLEYKYPNEDFCLFATFPHQNIIIPVLETQNNTECSCTLKWLLYYIPYYNSMDIYWLRNMPFIPTAHSYTCDSFNCNLSLYMNSCNTSAYNSSYEPHYFDLYNLRNTILDIQSIALDIFGPITAALAILANLGTVLAIHYAPKQKNNSKNESVCAGLLYRYMFWNAVINLTYSTVYFFFYLIKCSPRSRDQYGWVDDTCFQEQVYINVIGSVLKLMANFSFVQMCLNRFVLIGKDHPIKIVQIAETRPKKFWLIISPLSVLLSVVVYFNERIFGSQTYQDGQVLYEFYYYHNYYWYWKSTHKLDFMRIVQDKLDELPLVSPFLLIHDFFSYFFFCIASTVIDALTVKNLRKVLAEKRAKSSVDHQDQAKKSEIKSIIMIVLISVFNFSLRFPELFSTIVFYLLLFHKESHYIFKMLCFSYRECLPIVEITNVFCLLSLSLNFIFYVLFDNNFRIAFNHCLTKLKAKMKKAAVRLRNCF